MCTSRIASAGRARRAAREACFPGGCRRHLDPGRPRIACISSSSVSSSSTTRTPAAAPLLTALNASPSCLANCRLRRRKKQSRRGAVAPSRCGRRLLVDPRRSAYARTSTPSTGGFRMQISTGRLAAAVVTAATVVLSGAAYAAPGVTPTSVTAIRLPGQTLVVAKSVETSPIPPQPDIVFLADTTGSMDGAIANVRTNATSIMNSVRRTSPTRSSASPSTRTSEQSCRPVRVPAQPGRHRLDRHRAGGHQRLAPGRCGCDIARGTANALFELATNPRPDSEPGRRGSSSGSAMPPGTIRAAATRRPR